MNTTIGAPTGQARTHEFVFPYATAATCITLCALYAVQVRASVAGGILDIAPNDLVTMGGTIPRNIMRGEYYRLFVGMFLHTGLEHLICNLIALAFVGALIEGWIGAAGFIGLYVVGGVAGAVASTFLNNVNLVSVGASGAIMALLGAALVLSGTFAEERRRSRTMSRLIAWIMPSLIPLASGASGGKVDYAAHMGGVAAGLFIGASIVMLPQTRRVAALAGVRVIALLSVILVGSSAVQAYAVFVPTRAAHLLHQRAQLLRDKGNLIAATEKYDEAVLIDPRDPTLQFERALVYFRLNNYEAAEKGFAAVLRILPTEKPALFNRGLALLNMGRNGDAEAVFRDVLLIDKDDPDLYLNLSAALSRQEKREEAISILRDGAQKIPGNVKIQARLGAGLVAAKSFKEAIDPLINARSLGCKDPLNSFLLGFSMFVTGRKGEANKYLDEFLSMAGSQKQYEKQVAAAREVLAHVKD